MLSKDPDEVLICPSNEYDHIAMRDIPLETECMNRPDAHEDPGLFIEWSIKICDPITGHLSLTLDTVSIVTNISSKEAAFLITNWANFKINPGRKIHRKIP